MSNPQFKMKLISVAIAAVFSSSGAMAAGELDNLNGFTVNATAGAWTVAGTDSNLTLNSGTLTAGTANVSGIVTVGTVDTGGGGTLTGNVLTLTDNGNSVTASDHTGFTTSSSSGPRHPSQGRIGWYDRRDGNQLAVCG